MPKRPLEVSREAAREPEPTAQPRSLRDELKRRPVAEEGLSIDADELGRQFLADATEQDNFESDEDGDSELAATGAPPSDEALQSPAFDVDNGVWDETVELSLQGGGIDSLRRGMAVDDEPVDPDESGPRSLDLRSNVVSEGSLLDDEADEAGEVRSPDVHAENRPAPGTRSRVKR